MMLVISALKGDIVWRHGIVHDHAYLLGTAVYGSILFLCFSGLVVRQFLHQTANKLVQSHLEHLVPDTFAALVLDWG